MTQQLIKLRCSALPRALKCGGSVRPAELKVDVENEAAELGTAAHEWLARVVSGEHVDLDVIADRDLRILVALGIRMWHQLEEHFPGAVAERTAATREYPDRGFLLSGTVDVVARGEGYTSTADWKTGRLDSDYWAQIVGYCVLFAAHGDVATGAILWVRDEEVENYTTTQEQRDQFLDRITDEVVNWDGVYHPGSHCGFCPRYHECAAARAHERAAVQAFSREDLVDDIDAMDAVQQLDLYEQAGTVVRLAGLLREALRTVVDERGPIVSPARMLQLVEAPSYTIDPLAAWPVMDAFGLDDKAKAEAIKISKPALEDVVKRLAPPRKGAARIRELRDALEAAGALRVETGKRLKFGRAR